VYNSVTLDKIPVKAFYSRVPISDWSVVISVPEEEINETPQRVGSFLAASMIILLAIAIVAASWLARRSVKQVEELGETAQKMAQNEEVTYTPHKVHEIDMVRRQIADASAKIRNATKEHCSKAKSWKRSVV
jgi:methyl-accepting chemotaxis protein